MTPTRIGLVSDTHFPDRLPALPGGIFSALDGVDLVAHAGDVGALSVLDELGRIAPVMAVHGNDDSDESQRELPFQIVFVVGAHRVLLTHCHLPNAEDESAFRKIDAWKPKLSHYAERARNAGADVMLIGHLHIPFVVRHAGVWIVNAGALAAGNSWTRMKRQSVAVVELGANEPFLATHIDLASGQAFAPSVEWGAPFSVALEANYEWLLDDKLRAKWPSVRAIARGRIKPWVALLNRLAWPNWEDASAPVVAPITTQSLLAGIEATPDLPAELRARLVSVLAD